MDSSLRYTDNLLAKIQEIYTNTKFKSRSVKSSPNKAGVFIGTLGRCISTEEFIQSLDVRQFCFVTLT